MTFPHCSSVLRLLSPVGFGMQSPRVPTEGMLGEKPVPEAGEEKDAQTSFAGRPRFPRWHCGVFFYKLSLPAERGEKKKK